MRVLVGKKYGKKKTLLVRRRRGKGAFSKFCPGKSPAGEGEEKGGAFKERKMTQGQNKSRKNKRGNQFGGKAD